MPPETSATPIQPQTVKNPADATIAQTPPKKAGEGDTEVKRVRVTAHERAIKVKARLKEIEDSAPDPADEDKQPARPKTHAKSSPAGSEAEEEKPAKAKPKTEEAEKEAPAKEKEPPKPTPPPKQEAKKPKEEAEEPEETAEAKQARYREERQKRLAAAAEKERREQQERESKHRSSVSQAEIERLRKRVAELEPHEKVFSSEESLLAAAEARGMSAEKVAAWLREKTLNPNAVAQQQAKTVEERILSELAKERQAREDLERRIRERDEEAKAEREARARAQSFASMVDAGEESHPRVHGLVKRRGLANVVQFANEQILQYLPENYELSQLHDVMEQYLDWLHGEGEKPDQQNGQEPPAKKPGAAKPVTTLSNDLASARESVTENVPLHRMSKADRIARAKRLANDDND